MKNSFQSYTEEYICVEDRNSMMEYGRTAGESVYKADRCGWKIKRKKGKLWLTNVKAFGIIILALAKRGMNQQKDTGFKKIK